MSDNVAITAGSGTNIAADEVTDGTLGTVKVQYVKLMDATIDGTTKAAVGARGLAVDIAATAASIAKAEDVASADADVGVPALAVRKATPANTSGTDGDYEFLQISAGRLWVDASGKTLTVDGSGATQPVSLASGATAIAKAEDVASSDADVGVPAMAVRKATPANTSGTDGDYEFLQMSAGRLWADARPRAFSAVGTTLTRPANTTAYAANDSVSDNGTAGSVTALSATLSDTNDDPIFLTSITLDTTDTGIQGKTVRAYLYNSDPTASTGVGGGDNTAFSNKKAGFVGTMTGFFRTFSDGAKAVLVPDEGTMRIAAPTSGAKTLYYQLQALEAFTPSANSTTFIPTFNGFQARA